MILSVNNFLLRKIKTVKELEWLRIVTLNSVLYLKERLLTHGCVVVLFKFIVVLIMLSTPVALLPIDEAERLQSLHHYNVLQPLQEELFDELVTLTAALFRLPIAYIGLVDEQRLHYKAAFGFPKLAPQPRAKMLCSLIIRHNRLVVYHDLAAAEATSLDALAIETSLAQQVRFYAGTPLRMPDQRTIGTLCLVDRQPREFNADEQLLLATIAAVVSEAIVVRNTCQCDSLRWQQVCAQARDEVYALGALIRYLSARYGPATPLPEEIAQPVLRRLHDLHFILQECQ